MTRESLRDLSGVRHVFSGAVPAEPSAWATRLPCVPNRQICAQTTAHLTALTAIHTRRYTGDRRSPSPPGRITLDIRVIIADFFVSICGDDHPYITRSAHHRYERQG